jgi:hypothetical protein
VMEGSPHPKSPSSASAKMIRATHGFRKAASLLGPTGEGPVEPADPFYLIGIAHAS